MEALTLEELQKYIAENWVIECVDYEITDAIEADRRDPQFATLIAGAYDYKQTAESEGWKVAVFHSSQILYNPGRNLVYNREKNCIDKYSFPGLFPGEVIEPLCQSQEYCFHEVEGVTFYAWRKLCQEARIQAQEIESIYWAVTEPLAQLLIRQGECVSPYNGKWIWLRHSTGAIADESVIERIAKDWLDEAI